jgi:hypothetical protein
MRGLMFSVIPIVMSMVFVMIIPNVFALTFEENYSWEKEFKFGTRGIFLDGDVILNEKYSGQKLEVYVKKPGDANRLYDLVDIDATGHYAIILSDGGNWPVGQTKVELRHGLQSYVGYFSVVENVVKSKDGNRYLVWDVDCSTKGKTIITNIKEQPFGLDSEEIESYYYQIQDKNYKVISSGNNSGDLIVDYEQMNDANHIVLYSSQMLTKQQNMCDNKLPPKRIFSMDYQCPAFTDHTIVFDETREGDKYFLELKNNVKIKLDVLYSLQPVPDDLKVIVRYSDGSSLDFSPTTTSIQIPAKNNDASVTKYVATSEQYDTSEIDYACSSSYATQFTLKSQYEAKIESDKVEKIAANFCNELVYGCNASYDIKYDLNSENDFVKKMWTEDNSLLGVNKIDYDFTSANRNYFNFDSKIYSNDFSESTHVGSGNFEIGSQFIYPNNYDNNPNNMWDEEQVTMSIAGFNRNAVHYWSYVDLGITPYGDAEIQEDYYYDIDTGILLKFEQFRSLLDVSGKQNTEKILIKASSINFPKNTAGGGCLIATATYGSELAPEVQKLRELRDNSLLSSESGTNFMNLFNDVYYSFSPVIADYERENPVFKEMVKIAITPMITSLSILNYVDMDSEESVLGYGISLILLNGMMYVGIPILAVMRFRK